MKIVELEGLTARLVQETPGGEWVLEHQAEENGDWKSMPLDSSACWATVQNVAIKAYIAGVLEGVNIVMESLRNT